MPRPRTQPETLSPGQPALRSGMGVDCTRGLIDSGRLLGVLRIATAGRYEEAMRGPLAAVVHLEQDWAVGQSVVGPCGQGDGVVDVAVTWICGSW